MRALCTLLHQAVRESDEELKKIFEVLQKKRLWAIKNIMVGLYSTKSSF